MRTKRQCQKSRPDRNTQRNGNEITELQNFHKPTAGTINYREGHFRNNAKVRLEQKNDPVLGNLRAKNEGELLDESAFTQDNRYQHYLQNIPRVGANHQKAKKLDLGHPC